MLDSVDEIHAIVNATAPIDLDSNVAIEIRELLIIAQSETGLALDRELLTRLLLNQPPSINLDSPRNPQAARTLVRLVGELPYVVYRATVSALDDRPLDRGAWSSTGFMNEPLDTRLSTSNRWTRLVGGHHRIGDLVNYSHDKKVWEMRTVNNRCMVTIVGANETLKVSPHLLKKPIA